METKEFEKLQDCIQDSFIQMSAYAIEGVNANRGGPFGAAVIQKQENGKYKMISQGQNTVVGEKDPTCHAEVNAIRSACKKLNRFELHDCILITTAKSCPMCLSTCCWAQIPTVYYALEYEFASKAGFKDANILDYFLGKNHLITEVKVECEQAKEPFEVWMNKEDKILY